MTRERFHRVERVLREDCGVQFTGAVARIEAAGRVVFERAYGTTRFGQLARAAYVDSRFDLASITKLFVSSVALRLVAAGALRLDEPAGAFFPEWKGRPQAAITARMLLAHTSGMASGADYRTIRDDCVERFALERELVARAAGRDLAAVIRETFPSTTLGFRPSAGVRLEIPATEEDAWRGRVQGFVHDEKAYLMGGVAGHAGLFGTAADVAALTEGYLGALRGRNGPSSLLPAALAADAVREQAGDPVLRRGLGWALKTSDENSCGRWMGAASFGHMGFVGTCVWADPARDAQGVLLTNSVYFGRGDTRLLRARFYEAMLEDLGMQASP